MPKRPNEIADAPATPAPTRLMVRAKRLGFYANVLVHPGTVFQIVDEQAFAPWMERVEDRAAVDEIVAAKAAAVGRRQRELRAETDLRKTAAPASSQVAIGAEEPVGGHVI
jgi:hypothetical protein